MKRKITLLLVFISISYFSQSQYIYPINYSGCNTAEFFLEGKEINTKYEEQKLLQDLLQTIDTKTLSKIMGAIYFQVVVDTVGGHCCVSIRNELNSKGRKIDFKSIMDSQTNWSVPIRKGKKATVSAMIKIEFEKDSIVLKRMGFNGKTGWIELSSYEMKR